MSATDGLRYAASTRNTTRQQEEVVNAWNVTETGMVSTVRDANPTTFSLPSKMRKAGLLVNHAIVIQQVSLHHSVATDSFLSLANCALGSKQLQCAPDGKCECKPGVSGEKCDKCAANYWNFDYTGCDSCECKPEGSVDNTPQCDQETGVCACKQNVEGKKCDICAAGHFLIDAENEFGCTPCFCYGHTGECFDSGGYVKSYINSDFSRNDEKWQGYEDGQVAPNLFEFDATRKHIAVRSEGSGAYFYAPSK